ncbi:phosphoribosylamine--glycine ligase [Xiashengella succiniciproducens]|uniref:Phosphoribosylamine--glycine ligase n=1 Tax=Xiashengella succiniciproducens TaxID=2949635 RepID=A0A9J6ZQ96_9BACT|nr:phosphoribosylamine--glycine ligase [Alkaliflexus sp. Ai-910]URW79686.1 phosphoribosylamine--glycine ligase [Alkaliflexus sp. Ai-910]
MNILIVGSGGREHAFGWHLKRSPLTDKLFFAPGNAGTAAIGENLSISANDFDAIRYAVLKNDIKLVIVGPEEPLVRGIVDYFKSEPSLSGIKIIGPDSKAAALEGSKDFAKQFMQKYNIPTARYLTVTPDTVAEGRIFMASLSAPYVLKADGLAAGKGVLIINDYDEACEELNRILGGKFGAAGNKVVIEEFLSGIELSMFVLTDGKDYFLLPEAKDYKRVGEGDQGLNTGGMGAVSPVPFATDEFKLKVEEKIIKPTIEGIKKEGLYYKGFIFFGLIKVGDEPYVIEYNVRMGDPETEVVMPRLMNDLVELLQATAEGKLGGLVAEHDYRTAVTIVMVSGGYPGHFEKGFEITGLDKVDGSLVFHAGTKLSGSSILTDGGRLMAVTSFGDDIVEASELSRKNASLINYENKYYRRDIGFDLLD